MKDQLAIFKQNLEEFAKKYKKEIRKDPNFRLQFQKLCNQIGVDPLACIYLLFISFIFLQIFQIVNFKQYFKKKQQIKDFGQNYLELEIFIMN